MNFSGFSDWKKVHLAPKKARLSWILVLVLEILMTSPLNPKAETNLTTDSADSADSIGYDWRYPGVVPRKDLYGHLPIASSKSVKSAESAVPISESGLSLRSKVIVGKWGSS